MAIKCYALLLLENLVTGSIKLFCIWTDECSSTESEDTFPLGLENSPHTCRS
jgi:hypothetical protein